MTSIENHPFFCSWSGGKDSCLALYNAIRNGGIPKVLLTMLTEEGERTRSHGLPVDVVQSQAKALGIPLMVRKSSWDDYEENFLSAIRKFKRDGIEYGVFGDIDLEPHLEWVKRVCSSAGIQPCEPLWQQKRSDLLNEFLNQGFKATIVAIKQDALDNSFLGRSLDQRTIADIEKTGCDASGEKGEYHTVVTDGAIFSSAIHIETGDQVVHDGYCFLEIRV
jgi:diphthine-ammonia ligase